MEIIGYVEHRIFENEENNYKVLSIATEDKLLTVNGYFEELIDDLEYCFKLNEKHHPIYGEQYEVLAYHLHLPTETEKLEYFLASGLIEGIGSSLAKKIVQTFGEQTLEIIRNHPERLREVQGIGADKCQKIADSLSQQLGREEVYLFLSGFDITLKMAKAIYDYFGEDIIAKVKANPYALLHKIPALGFKKIDQMALKLGFAIDSELRIRAIILDILAQFTYNGNMYMPYGDFKRRFNQFVQQSEVPVDDLLARMTAAGSIVYEIDEKEADASKIYLDRSYQIEVGILKNIVRLALSPLEELTLHGNCSDLELSDEQQNAVDNGLNEPIYILTGGPGTGKTTVLKEWVYRLEKLNISYLLCAPTGRAASRMESVIGRSASTIHRMLEFQYENDKGSVYFQRSEENPLDSDFVFVDEASMLDAALFYALLKALKSGTHLILIGDINQLPSVGAGAVLADLLASPIPRSALTEIHRQAADSLILKNAHAILNQNTISLNKKGGDFYFVQQNNPTIIRKQLIEIVSERLPNYYGISPDEITVLTPVRAGMLGCEDLNLSLQATLNPRENNYFKHFRIDDKVMQNKNNYTLEWQKQLSVEQGIGVFNGEIGRVKTYTDEGLVVEFDEGKLAVYDYESAMDLRLAYALTIHKSQGNEFDYVVIVLPRIPPLLRSRNLIYTAITRAKKHLTIIGDINNFNQLLTASQSEKRYTGLDQKLNEVFSD